MTEPIHSQASEEARAIEDILDRLAEVWPISDAITTPDEAAMFEAPVRSILRVALDRVSRERTRQALERAAKALQALADYSEPPFDHPPEEWAKHTPETCAECAEWKARKHPIQHACDGFYRLLHSRDDHRAFDRQAEGPRMRMIAREALRGLSDGESVASEEKEE